MHSKTLLDWRTIRRLALGNALWLALGIALPPRLTYGQARESKSDPIAISIARAQSGKADASDVEVIARARAAQAIPALEAQFARTADLSTKTKIADGLVRLGDKDNAYWDFLLQQATLAVDSDVPDPFHDSQGIAMDHPSPEFTVWAKEHNVDTNTAVRSAIYDLPGKVLQLAETGDPRGIPLLRRALQSHNYFVAGWAAKGLAQIRDKESIPLIIAAAQRAPTEYKSQIAESLVYFDDPQAQNAVDSLLPAEGAKMAREQRAHGRGVFGW